MEETTTAERKAAREKKRRRIQIIRRIKVGTVLCIGLAVLLYLLSAFVFFKVETIDVVGITDENGNTLPGSSFYTNEEIIRISGVNIGDSLVLLSKHDTKESIEKLLPYIGNVKVQRKYPSSLKLTVEDTASVFALDDGGGYTLMNEKFKVLEKVAKVPSGSAKIVGIPVVSDEIGTIAKFNDEANKNRLNTVVDAFNDAEIDNITKIDLSNIANVKVTVDGRFTLVLGTLTQLNEKLSIGIKTIDAEIANNPDAKVIIDLTDPDRSYVRDDYSPIENEEESSMAFEADDSQEKPEDEPEEKPEDEKPAEEPENVPDAVG